jgi:anthranilate phosphoribosyltransferase
MEAAIDHVMSGEAAPAQVGAFLAALRMKGERPVEIAAAARCLRRLARPLEVAEGPPLVDTCGTGGDGLDTPNVSTMVALVAAAGGLRVAKHGNRSVSSKCGSADLLEALGVDLEPSDERVAGALETTGITFLYAPRFHPAMRHAGPIRRAMGVRTLFNILGPLANPLAATRQVLGVFDPGLTEVLATTLGDLGVERALVVHGDDGMDELTTTTTTRGHELDQGEVRPFTLDPTTLGIDPPTPEDLLGGGPDVNATIARELLAGGGRPGLKDLVALNAGAALWMGGATGDLVEGLARARELLESGAPMAKLEEWVAYLSG